MFSALLFHPMGGIAPLIFTYDPYRTGLLSKSIMNKHVTKRPRLCNKVTEGFYCCQTDGLINGCQVIPTAVCPLLLMSRLSKFN